MSLKEEDRRILVELELEKAEKTFSQMETLREKSDYNCFFNVTETDIVSKIAPTSSFIEKVKQYVAEQK